MPEGWERRKTEDLWFLDNLRRFHTSSGLPTSDLAWERINPMCLTTIFTAKGNSCWSWWAKRSRRNLSDQIPPVSLILSGCFIQPPLGRPDPTAQCVALQQAWKWCKEPETWAVQSFGLWQAMGRDWHSQTDNCPAEAGAIQCLRQLRWSKALRVCAQAQK